MGKEHGAKDKNREALARVRHFLSHKPMIIERKPSPVEQILLNAFDNETAVSDMQLLEQRFERPLVERLKQAVAGWKSEQLAVESVLHRAFDELPTPIYIRDRQETVCNRAFSSMLEHNRDIQTGCRSTLHVSFVNFTERLLASEHIRVAKLFLNCGGTTFHIRTVALPEKGVKVAYYLPTQIGDFPTLAPLELNVHLLGISGLTAKEIAWLLERRLTKIQYVQKSNVLTFDRIRKSILKR